MISERTNLTSQCYLFLSNGRVLHGNGRRLAAV